MMVELIPVLQRVDKCCVSGQVRFQEINCSSSFGCVGTLDRKGQTPEATVELRCALLERNHSSALARPVGNA